MVPIHDTDLSQERWSQADWENYELWEKVEQRLKRRKRLWILGTVCIFLILSSIPIIMDRGLKWKTRALARHLALEINRVKKEASIGQKAMRFRFVDENSMSFVIESVSDCTAKNGEVIRAASLEKVNQHGKYRWLSHKRGLEYGIPGLTHEFCYDPFLGSAVVKEGESLVGFGIIPVNDLTEKRMDRLTLLLLSGVSAEISFD